jgi:hypothetical protein
MVSILSKGHERMTSYTRDELKRIAASPYDFMQLSVEERRNFVLAWITEFPEKHDQALWGEANITKFTRPNEELSCGTAACVAGWASLFAGAYPLFTKYTFSKGTQFIGPLNEDTLREDELAGWELVVVPEGGNVVSERHVENFAAEVLGLDMLDANTLFDAENSRERIVTYIGRLNTGLPIDRTDWYEDSY